MNEKVKIRPRSPSASDTVEVCSCLHRHTSGDSSSSQYTKNTIMWRSGQRKSSEQNQDPQKTKQKQKFYFNLVIRDLHLWCFQLNWETWSLCSVRKPPPDWQKVQICVLICLIKAPGSAGIVFKIWFMYKPSARWVTLLIIFDCHRKMGQLAGVGRGGAYDAKPKSWISLCSFNSSEYEIT